LKALRERGAKSDRSILSNLFSGVAVPSLEGRIFTIEGETQAVRVARRIARALGGSPVRIAGSKKLLYHAAAAMAAGQVLRWRSCHPIACLAGNEAREAVRGLLPLTRQVLENFERLGPRPHGRARSLAEITKSSAPC